jgi:hypothetical protein
MYKCDIGETTYELQVIAALYIYDGLALAKEDLHHQKSTVSGMAPWKTFYVGTTIVVPYVCYGV